MISCSKCGDSVGVGGLASSPGESREMEVLTAVDGEEVSALSILGRANSADFSSTATFSATVVVGRRLKE